MVRVRVRVGVSRIKVRLWNMVGVGVRLWVGVRVGVEVRVGVRGWGKGCLIRRTR